MGVQVLSFSLFIGPLAFFPKVAVSASYVLAVSCHFLLNRSLTFKARDGDFLPHIKKYLVVAAINYLNTIAVFDAVVRVLALSPYLGLFASIGATVITGFFLMKFWVFRVSA